MEMHGQPIDALKGYTSPPNCTVAPSKGEDELSQDDLKSCFTRCQIIG